MPKAVLTEQSEYFFPAGEFFNAVLSSVEEESFEYHKKDKRTKQAMYDENNNAVMATLTKWRWEFVIQDGEFEGVTAYGDTFAEFTTRADNKPRQWAEALRGKEYEVGEEFDTDDLLGLPCLISMRHDDPRKRADGTFFYGSPVHEVLPADSGMDEIPF